MGTSTRYLSSLWSKAVDVSLRAPDGEIILDMVCQVFLKSNQLDKAEALYLAMGRHDLAVQMYQNKNLHGKALNILTQAGDSVINEKQGIVEDLVSKGRGKEAQDMLARTGDITGYISLSKKLGLWEDALNMSEKLGADELFSVVYDWYNAVGPEKPARVLLRNNKLQECINTGIKKGEGRFVLSIGKAGGILNLGDIIDQVVKQNIQNGNVNEAATLLKENGKYAEIVQLYIKNELWKEANTFAMQSGDMNTIKQVQEAELDAAKRQKDLSKLEELALRLGRVQIAVDAFVEAGLHADADRLRNEYSLPSPSNNAKDIQSDYLTSFPRSFNLNIISSPSSSSAIDKLVENNDWSSALALALSMNSDVLPDLLHRWLSSLGDVKSLSLNEILPLMSRYGAYLPTESVELLLAAGKELCGQPWSLDYKIWAEIRDCFWNAAELWGLSDNIRPIVERYFWATHLMAVKCASATQTKSESLAAKSLIGLLRYADLIPADWLFLEAGKYAQRQEWLTAAFILYNAGLDLCDVIEEGTASDGIDPVEWEEWAELGVPIDQLRLEELKCEESKIEKARDWVLSISLDPRAAKDVSIGAYDGLSEFLGGRMASGCVLTGCTAKPPIVKFECQLAASRSDFDLLRSGDNWPDLENFLQKWLGRPVE